MLYLCPQKDGRKKTLDIVASSMYSPCDIDKTYNSILKMPWYQFFSYTDFYCSQNGLNTMKVLFICKGECSFNQFCENIDCLVSHKL